MALAALRQARRCLATTLLEVPSSGLAWSNTCQILSSGPAVDLTNSTETAITHPWQCIIYRSFSHSPRKRGKALSGAKAPREVESDEMLPQICIVGRPNVGKSALYNRLVRRKEALVFDTPGSHVTRDYREGTGQLGDLQFRVIDTSGLEPYLPTSTLQSRAAQLTSRMMQRSDLVLLMLDGREGVLPADREISAWMRAEMKSRVVVVANKCERRWFTGEAEHTQILSEAETLGLGEPVAISAAHGEGMAELYETLQSHVDAVTAGKGGQPSEAQLASVDGDATTDLKAFPLKLALVGLPNVGKSTLCNRLVGEERSLTGPEPGLTRDSVSSRFAWDGWRVDLVDTAGWMRKTRLDRYDDVGGAVAKMASFERMRTVRMTHAVALLIDSHAAFSGVQGFTRRELAMASEVAEEGRGLVLVLNKFDLVPPDKRAEFLESVRDMMRRHLPQLPGLPLIPMSAATGEGVERLMPAVEGIYEEWNRRIGTGELNRWFAKVKARQEGNGNATGISKVKYITQVKRRPPSFSAFVTGTKTLPDSSARFITNALREDYGMFSVPIQVVFRTNTVDTRPRK